MADHQQQQQHHQHHQQQQPHNLVEIDPDFEPLSRPRSCTWPLPRPEFINPAGGPGCGAAGGGGDSSNAPSPVPCSVKQEPDNSFISCSLSLLEETDDFSGSSEHKASVLLQQHQCSCNDFQCQETCVHHQQQSQHHQHQQQQLPHQQQQQVSLLSSPVGASSSAASSASSASPSSSSTSSSAAAAAAAAAAQRKSSSSRRNAWGNMSYADLITKAIESSPETRLTLSQIYDWMVKSVPYFKDKGDSNSSAGWKNSIRHNLSLHSRFIRVQNEGTGKSSWWMLNPEGGKSGKSPRRRAASMDNNSKFTKSRGRAAKKKLSLQGGPEGGADSPGGGSYSKWPGSPNSHSNDDFDAWSSFRPRTSSNASTLSGRLSPFMPEDDLGEVGDVHMVYPGAPGGPKMTATLPSLTEMTGSLGHSSENVMESLLDNLNLLSPQNNGVGQVGGAGGGGAGATPGSAQSSPSPMMQQASPGGSGPGGYPSYSSSSQQQAQQDYHRKCVYGQAGGMGALSPLQALQPDVKPGGGGGFGVPSSLGQYSCPAGLLKELLTSDSDPHNRELHPSVDTVVSQGMLPPYGNNGGGGGGQQQQKLMGVTGGNAHPRGLSHNPHGQHPHSNMQQPPPPPSTVAMNGRLLMSLNHNGGGSGGGGGMGRMPALKGPMQMPYGLAAGHHGGVMPGGGGFCPINGGYGGRTPGGPGGPHHHHHHHHHHQPLLLHPERLPSDLDDMSIERFECDMESILHDTLMDGDSLDFNFEPMVVPSQQGFSSLGVKTTTHSWVSG